MGMSMRVLVTGGSGMVGANLVHRLVKEGNEVAVLVRPATNRLRLQHVERQLQFVCGDLRDAVSIQTAVRQIQPHVVFHLASTIWAKIPALPPSAHLETNALGTLHLLEAVRIVPGARFVFTGSSSVYGPGSQLHEQLPLAPNTFYGATKAAASLLVQTYARVYGVSTVELRLFMPYGPWEDPNRLVPQVILSALAGRDIPTTAGMQQRDLIYMDDVVDALLLAAARPVPAGSVFNIGSGSAMTVRELIERLLHLMGNPVKALIGALPMRPDEIVEMSASIAAANTQLGWKPLTSLDEGLRRTIAWFTDHRELSARLAQRGSDSVREPVGASR